MKWKVGEFYARAMAGLPRILFGHQRGNLRHATLGLIKWLKYSRRKTLRGKLPVRYQVPTLRFAEFGRLFIFEQMFGLNIDDKYVLIFCIVLWPKYWHFGLCCQTNGDMQRKSGGAVGLAAVMMARYTSWCHSHITMTLKLNSNEKQII